MSAFDDDFPVGLERPERVDHSWRNDDLGLGEAGSVKPVRQPAKSSIHSRNGPERLGKSLALTVIPELEPTIPWMGAPKWRYELFWKPIGKPNRRPKLNRKNVLSYEIDYLEKRLAQLSNVVRPTIGVHNSIGGSGKSTTAIYLASIIYIVTHALTYAMSATNNLRTTALAAYAGVEDADGEEQAQRVHELVSLSKREVDFRTVGGLARRSTYGVRIVAEDRPKTLQKSEGFKTPQFIRAADALYSACDVLIFDCGNDNVEPDSIPMEVARRSDVTVMVANVENPLSLRNLARELAILASDESPGMVEPGLVKPRSSSQIPTREKTEKAVVVFTNTSPGQKAEDFVQYLPEGFKGVALTVPKEKNIQPADPFLINQYTTYHAFLEAATAAFEMAARLQGVRLPEPLFAAS